MVSCKAQTHTGDKTVVSCKAQTHTGDKTVVSCNVHTGDRIMVSCKAHMQVSRLWCHIRHRHRRQDCGVMYDTDRHR